MSLIKYSKLNSLKAGSKVDVYGVVKFVKPPFKSRGTDYCITLSITDQSYEVPDQKLKCNLFAKDESKLPLVKVGEIIRFHRLNISSYQGDLQAVNSPGIAWLIFSGSRDGPLEPRHSSTKNYTFTDTDKKIVGELREWIASQKDLQEKLTKFEDIAVGCYFDTICQVVCTAVAEPSVCMLLKVWDGTQSLYEPRKADDTTLTEKKEAQKLLRCSQDFLHDVFAFDNHFPTAKNVSPGDFVKFCNLHAAEWTSDKTVKHRPCMPPIELVLHRGNSYGRSLRVISPDSSEIGSLKRRLRKITERYDDDEDIDTDSDSNVLKIDTENSSCEIVCISEDSSIEILSKTCNQNVETNDNAKTSTNKSANDQQKTLVVHATENEKQRVGVHDSQEPSTSGINSEEKVGKVISLGSNSVELISEQAGDDGVSKQRDKMEEEHSRDSLPRCMMKTASITLNHPHIKPTAIKDVLDHDVPYKFRIRAKIVDYYPKPTDVQTFLQLYCPQCHHLCAVPQKDCNENNQSATSQLTIGSTFNGVVHYNCPQCFTNKESLTDLDSPPHLHFIYMMRFLLKDETAVLMANIWRSDAVEFFQKIEPERLVRDETCINQIRDLLNDICPEGATVEEKPWLECCVRSYSVSDGTCYQIFDSTIA